MTNAALGHEEAFELLPWLVNGTLRGEERERVDRHVASCLVCRAELKSQFALQAFVKEQPTVSWSAESGYERLARQLDAARAADADRRTLPRALLQGVARLLQSPMRVAGVAGVAAGLAAIAWFGLIGQLRSPATFTTLTEAAADSALYVDIVFAAGVDETARRELIDELGAAVVAGPSDVGRLTLGFAAGQASPEQLDALIAALQADPRVRFAGRNFMLEQPEGSR